MKTHVGCGDNSMHPIS